MIAIKNFLDMIKILWLSRVPSPWILVAMFVIHFLGKTEEGK